MTLFLPPRVANAPRAAHASVAYSLRSDQPSLGFCMCQSTHDTHKLYCVLLPPPPGAALVPRGWARRRASSPSCRLVFEVSRPDHGAISSVQVGSCLVGAEDMRIGWYITSLASEALLLLSNNYHESVATRGSANVCLCRVQDACPGLPVQALEWKGLRPWESRV